MVTLDPRLQNDTVFIGRLPLCQVLLMNDSRYPWLILVPNRENLFEPYHLSEEDRLQLSKESNWVLERMADFYAAKSMNVAALGNVVAQLHVHHIARFENDPAWPGPVWGHSAAVPYSAEALEQRVHELKGMLATRFVNDIDANEVLDQPVYW